jgi:hypothetical protein
MRADDSINFRDGTCVYGVDRPNNIYKGLPRLYCWQPFNFSQRALFIYCEHLCRRTIFKYYQQIIFLQINHLSAFTPHF